jgi:hypothetical protein
MLNVAGAGGKLRQQMELGNIAFQDNTALTAEAEVRYNTFSSQMTMLWNELRDVGITLGQELIPLVKDMIPTIKSLGEGIVGIVKWFGDLDSGTQKWIVGFAAVAAIIPPLIIAVGSLVAAGGALGITIGGLTTAFAALTGPIGLTVMALGAGYLAWQTWGEDIKRVVGNLVTDVRMWLNEKLFFVFDAIKGKIDAVKGYFQGLYDDVVGHSSVPDMMRGIQLEFSKLNRYMVTPAEDASQKVKERFREMNSVFSEMFGESTLTKLRDYSLAVERIGGVSVLTADQKEKYNAVLRDSIDLLGNRAPAALKATEVETRQLASSTTSLYMAMQQFVGISSVELGTAAQQAMQAARGLTEEGFRPLLVASRDLTEALSGVRVETNMMANEMASQSIGVLQNLSNTLRDQLGPIIMQAFTGGGNVAKSVGALVGQTFSESFLSKGLGSSLTNMFGSTVGGALGSVIPGVGTLIGSQLGEFMMKGLSKVGDWFKDLFGGPSKEEKEGRGIVGEFEKLLEGTLTATQKLEAGTEKWKMTVIAVRDAYIANGLTERQALDDTKRLWDASREGPEAVKRVIDEITQRMGGSLPSAVRAGTDSMTTGLGIAGGAASRFGQVATWSYQQVKDQVVILAGKIGDTEPVFRLQQAIEAAAAAGVEDFSFMADRINAMKQELGEPIDIDVNFNVGTPGRRGEEGTSPGKNVGNNLGMSESMFREHWLRQPGQSDSNEQDWQRVKSQYGFAGGTHGELVNFGAGTNVRLHGWERVQTEAEVKRGDNTRPIEIRIPLTLDGRIVTEQVVRLTPQVLAAHGLV